MKYFVKPGLDAYPSVEGLVYWQEYKTYSQYNYLRPGVASYIKARHFEVALSLTRKCFHDCNVIDFGCADGIFLPSLSRHFSHVTGVDNNPKFIRTCEGLLSRLDLKNVQLICNDNLTIDKLRPKLIGRSYSILYLLETLEHVGDRDSPYESRIDFLREIATLIAEDGMIVISVPKMVGFPFLIQRIGLAVLRLPKEDISFTNLLKSSLFNNTDALEETWEHEKHLGFNHKKLETPLGAAFRILQKKELFFQVLYVMRKR